MSSHPPGCASAVLAGQTWGGGLRHQAGRNPAAVLGSQRLIMPLRPKEPVRGVAVALSARSRMRFWLPRPVLLRAQEAVWLSSLRVVSSRAVTAGLCGGLLCRPCKPTDGPEGMSREG